MATNAPLKWSDLQAVFVMEGETKDDGRVLLFCFNCRKEGHTDAHCREPRRCYMCLKPTHQGYQCMENPVPGSSAFRPSERCDHCNERGHTAVFCRRPGGASHGRRADTVYPRPLVLYVANNGPTEADVRMARVHIMELLERTKLMAIKPTTQFATSTLVKESSSPTTAFVPFMRHDLVKMRDSEFFCLVLPLINDPAAGLSPSDQGELKSCLFKMRGAVAGGIRLDTKKVKATNTVAIARDTDDKDLLYDMKASGLDINILHGDKLNVFHRSRSAAAAARLGGSHVGASSHGVPTTDPSTHEGGEGVLRPEGIVADYVYLSTRGQSPNKQRKGAQPVVQRSSPERERLPTKTAILRDTLDGLDVKSPLSTRKAPRQGTVHTSDGERFVAPVPPHMRQQAVVAQQVLQQWVSKESGTPSTPGGRVDLVTSRPTGPVRSFLEATQRRQLETSSKDQTVRQPSRPTSAKVWSVDGCSNDGTICDWNRYRKHHPQRPPSPQQVTPLSSSSNRAASNDIVQGWRDRFDSCKATDAKNVHKALARRAVHRRVVTGDQHRYEELAKTLVESIDVNPQPSTSSLPAGHQSLDPWVNNMHSNLWTARCESLAVQEAEATLRSEIIKEVEEYSSRIGLAADTYTMHRYADRDFLAALAKVTLEAENLTSFASSTARVVAAFAPKFQSGSALLNRVCRVAHSLFGEMLIAQVNGGNGSSGTQSPTNARVLL